MLTASFAPLTKPYATAEAISIITLATMMERIAELPPFWEFFCTTSPTMSLPPVEPLTDSTIGKLIPCNAPPMMTYTTRSPAELESMIPSSNFAALQARNAIIKPDKNTTYSNVRSAKPLRKRKKQIISTGMLSNSTHTPADMYHSELSMLLFSM